MEGQGSAQDLTREGLASLKPLFKVDGSVTGGNWAPPADGAAAFVVAAGDGLRSWVTGSLGSRLRPLAPGRPMRRGPHWSGPGPG